MITRFTSFISLLLLTILSCNSENKNESVTNNQPEVSDTLFYTVKIFSEKFGPCKSPENLCLTIQLDYPYFEGSDSVIVNKLNKCIKNEFVKMIGGDTSMSLETVSKNRGNEFEAILKESPEFAMSWFYEGITEIIFENKNFISLAQDMSAFEGGAHPNSFGVLYTFDLITGKKLSLEDVFIDLKKVTAFVEEEFRKEKNIPKGQLLSDAGYDFENENFYISKQFSISGEEVIISYVTYEIAAYVVGPTILHIPMEKMKEYIKPEILDRLNIVS